jgi:death-on-curing protein
MSTMLESKLKADIRYLSANDVIEINKRIGEKGVVMNQGALENMLERQEIAHSLSKKAAIMLTDIVEMHMFLDGNKRTAFVATTLFLEMNGVELKYSKQLEREVTGILYNVARGDLGKVEVEEWFRGLIG